MSKLSSLGGLTADDKALLTKMAAASSYDELVTLLQNNGIDDLSKYFDNLIVNYTKERSSSSVFSFYTKPTKSVQLSLLLSSLHSVNNQVKKLSADTAALTLKNSEVVGNEKYLVTSNTDKVWNSSTKMYDGFVNIY